jgi:hypothetical protein
MRAGHASPARRSQYGRVKRSDREDTAENILSVMEMSYPIMPGFNCCWKAVFVVRRALHCVACLVGLASSSCPSSINQSNVPALH